MEELQSACQVLSITHYCSLFRAAFQLLDFDIEELKEALIADPSEDPHIVRELVISLLRGYFQRDDITAESYTSFLRSFLEERWHGSHPLNSPFPSSPQAFSSLPTSIKVDILQSLCDSKLEADDVAQALKGFEADHLQIDPVGSDSLGNVYWYFCSTRLYREEPPKRRHSDAKISDIKRKRGRPRKSDESPSRDLLSFDKSNKFRCWSVACSTEEEWMKFADQFKSSQTPCEKNLYRCLQVDLLPLLREVQVEKAKLLKKKLLELAPRRASSRIEVRRIEEEKEEDEKDKQCLLEEAQRKREGEEQAKKERQDRRGQDRLKATQDRSERQRLRETKPEDDPKLCEEESHEEEEEEEEEQSDEQSEDDDSSQASSSDDHYGYSINSHQKIHSVMESVLKDVKVHRNVWPFLQPVDEAHAPGYHDIIKEPMDISTIERKVQDRRYQSIKEFEKDFRKMINNCEVYNGVGNAYTNMSYILWRFFVKTLRQKARCFGPLHLKSAHLYVRSVDPESLKITIRQSEVPLQTSGKRRKRPPGMKAIEALARAAEKALKDAASSSFDDSSAATSQGSSPAYLPNSAFPDLKISTTQSHPAELLQRFFASALQTPEIVSASSHLPPKMESRSPSKNFKSPQSLGRECSVSISKREQNACLLSSFFGTSFNLDSSNSISDKPISKSNLNSDADQLNFSRFTETLRLHLDNSIPHMPLSGPSSDVEETDNGKTQSNILGEGSSARLLAVSPLNDARSGFSERTANDELPDVNSNRANPSNTNLDFSATFPNAKRRDHNRNEMLQSDLSSSQLVRSETIQSGRCSMYVQDRERWEVDTPVSLSSSSPPPLSPQEQLRAPTLQPATPHQDRLLMNTRIHLRRVDCDLRSSRMSQQNLVPPPPIPLQLPLPPTPGSSPETLDDRSHFRRSSPTHHSALNLINGSRKCHGIPTAAERKMYIEASRPWNPPASCPNPTQPSYPHSMLSRYDDVSDSEEEAAQDYSRPTANRLHGAVEPRPFSEYLSSLPDRFGFHHRGGLFRFDQPVEVVPSRSGRHGGSGRVYVPPGMLQAPVSYSRGQLLSPLESQMLTPLNLHIPGVEKAPGNDRYVTSSRFQNGHGRSNRTQHFVHSLEPYPSVRSHYSSPSLPQPQTTLSVNQNDGLSDGNSHHPSRSNRFVKEQHAQKGAPSSDSS